MTLVTWYKLYAHTAMTVYLLVFDKDACRHMTRLLERERERSYCIFCGADIEILQHFLNVYSSNKKVSLSWNHKSSKE